MQIHFFVFIVYTLQHKYNNKCGSKVQVSLEVPKDYLEGKDAYSVI